MQRTGRIVKVLKGAGYAFIRDDERQDGNDCFMSLFSWPMVLAAPTVGQRVTFESEPTPSGPRVTRVLGVDGIVNTR